ncbi:family 16 glycosylhydrolase [Cerasicoccus maritimus]|uniref:family 16 glycosylhydrolase n=1 Tax=Cerasicoccus maritimus TaxID=490089 RepID=UPI002852ACBE|nr:family 16 glycosylhydrolase [Cerasicoccus maritimus]
MRIKYLLGPALFVLFYTLAFSAPPPERNWTPTLLEEFNAFDATTWVIKPNAKRYDITLGGEALETWWYANNCYVENGNLVIRSIYQDDLYTSGCVTTSKTFTNKLFEQQYGYFEARVRVAQDDGMWSAFWLMPQDIYGFDGTGRDGAEIDIMESPHLEDRGFIQHAIHFDGYHAYEQEMAAQISIPDLNDGDYHVYGLWWTPEKYTFYVDGVKTWEVTDPKWISQVQSYVLLSVEIAPWGGDIRNANLPAYTYYDYVRVYADAGPSGQAEGASFTASAELLSSPGFESSVAGWSSNANLNTTTSDPFEGVYAASVTGRTADWNDLNQSITSYIQAEGPGSYAVSAMVKSASANVTDFVAQLEVVDANGTEHVSQHIKVDTAGEWQQVSGVLVIQPEGLISAKLRIRPDNSSVLDDFEVDAVSLKKLSFAQARTDQVYGAIAAMSVGTNTVETVGVDYSATTDREVVVSLIRESTGLVLGSSQTQVSAGAGRANIDLSIGATTEVDNDYYYEIAIREVGTATMLDVFQSDYVDVDGVAEPVFEVLSVAAPTQVTPNSTHYIDVEYTSTASMDIVVTFQRNVPSYTAYGNARVAISAGTSVVSIPVNIGSVTDFDNSYQFQTFIAPTGGNWGQRVDNLAFTPVLMAPTATADSVVGMTGPISVSENSSVEVTVDYTATESRDIVVVLQYSGGSYEQIASLRQTVYAGESSVTLSLPIGAAVGYGSNYQYQTFIGPVGSNWGQRLDNFAVTGVSVTP